MKLAIIENEAYLRSELSYHVKLCLGSYDDLDLFENEKTFIEAAGLKTYDLVFYNIDHSEDQGQSTLQHDYVKKTHFVLMSAHVQSLLDVYDPKIISYVAVPYHYEKIQKIVRTFAGYHENFPVIWMKAENERYAINIKEIISIYSVYQHFYIKTTRGILCVSRYYLNKYGSKLFEYGIARVHDSFYVNFAHVVSMKDCTFIMDDGSQVEIGRKYQVQVVDDFLDYVETH